jgi:hypothetical protein
MLLATVWCSLFASPGLGLVLPMTTKERWMQKSIQYYSRITRGSEQRTQPNAIYLREAMENYFAREKVKKGQTHHAESIYRRLMEEMSPDECHGDESDKRPECNFSSLAVPTLLLGLLLQREERYDDARTVFEGFSRFLLDADSDCKCCCCARVLQAHALFEMKMGNPKHALVLITEAIRLDRNLRPVLRWKQFDDALQISKGKVGNFGYKHCS